MTSLYENIHDQWSWLSHPSVMALQSFYRFDGHRQVLIDGSETREHDRDLRPFRMGLWVLDYVLMVSSLHWGRPEERRLLNR
jgi:hypothetical protein